mmetsp:Transcript_7595/g.27799  ORF Transcript_7595/g.27799 Transcript_7595/m.27799 type:complete len:174 (-) Transcript_7595:1362-1883(-)
MDHVQTLPHTIHIDRPRARRAIATTRGTTHARAHAHTQTHINPMFASTAQHTALRATTVAPKQERRARVAASAETVNRRAALVAFTAGATLVARQALAITIPSQASSGGIGRENGRAYNSSTASMGAYTLEGTRKQGMSVKQKRGAMSRAREEAEAEAGKAKAKAEEPAPKKK